MFPWKEFFLALLPLIAEGLQGLLTRKEEKKKAHKKSARRIKDALKTRDPDRINAALTRRGMLDDDSDPPV